MIEQLLPDDIVWEEAHRDPSEATLFAEEAKVVAKAFDIRRREFTTVRHCARKAMAKLNIPAAPLVPGLNGAPLWPDGVVGSMTHCVGYRAAVVGLRKHVLTIGIDAEPHAELPDGVLEVVASPDERHRIATLAAVDSRVWWDRILFSAKESVYKAWFPLTAKRLGFEETDVTIYSDGSFMAHLCKQRCETAAISVSSFTGRWLVMDGLIITAITVRARGFQAAT